ncbi:seminal metalloprotease 1-like [Cochliomyia hominivorax]
MELKIVIILLSLFLLRIQAAPIELDVIEKDPELVAGYYEGDMILATPRNDVEQVSYIEQAMQAIESASCIRFYQAPNDTFDYIKITGNSSGCFSNVGYLGREQVLNLQVNKVDQGCFLKGKIVHELLHSLGFYHQQSATNRDDYITVMYENIDEHHWRFFRKIDEKFITDYGLGYDYDSVMHYSAKAFTKNGKDTIVPLDPDAKIGQRIGLSLKDILKINLMYNCYKEETLNNLVFIK